MASFEVEQHGGASRWSLFGTAVTLSAGDKARITGDRRITGFCRLFSDATSTLDSDQKLVIQRQLLESLSHRVVYWMVLVLVASAFVFVFGSWMKPSDVRFWHRIVWMSGLWAITAFASIYLLRRTTALVQHAPAEEIKRMHWTWAILVILMSIWWSLASLWLAPPIFSVRVILPPTYRVGFGSYNFLELTLLGQVFTLLLLAPSLRASLGALVFGAIAFGLRMGEPLLINRPWILERDLLQSAGYCLVAWFLFSEQKRAFVKEMILVEARSQAEAATAEKNQFIAAISHDLRQPLTTLDLKLNYLERNIESPKLNEGVQIAQRQVDAMEGMINGALDICRLESGTWKVEMQAVVLSSVLSDIVTDIQPFARAKGIKLRLHDRPYLVRTDRHALDRIVRNLLTNAVRYTPSEQNGKNGHILVSCQSRGGLVRICVWDNGIGIPGDRHEDIFKNYVQIGNPERNREKGFGLGLSIVKGLANLLDHELSVDSKPGRGSCFSVMVPFIERIPPELLGAHVSEDRDPDLTDMVVVVIDDNSDLRLEISTRLIECGCYVVGGQSSHDVIELLRNETLESGPHFILSDYRLESEDGIEAIESIRAATGASTPAILWSGDTSSAVLKRVAASGMKLLSKPVSEHTLLALLAGHKPKG